MASLWTTEQAGRRETGQSHRGVRVGEGAADWVPGESGPRGSVPSASNSDTQKIDGDQAQAG